MCSSLPILAQVWDADPTLTMSKSSANLETIIRLGPAMCETQAQAQWTQALCARLRRRRTTRVSTVGSLDSLATSAGETASKECTTIFASIEFEYSSSPKEEEEQRFDPFSGDQPSETSGQLADHCLNKLPLVGWPAMDIFVSYYLVSFLVFSVF